jgi:hypothetical protein
MCMASKQHVLCLSFYILDIDKSLKYSGGLPIGREGLYGLYLRLCICGKGCGRGLCIEVGWSGISRSGLKRVC